MDLSTYILAKKYTDEHGSAGTTDHTQLTNRDAAEQHPISAIAGLSDALGDKQDALTAGDNITIENNVISATGGSTPDEYIKSISKSIDGKTITYVDEDDVSNSFSAGNTVSASATGTSTTEAKYITIDDTEWKLPSGGGTVPSGLHGLKGYGVGIGNINNIDSDSWGLTVSDSVDTGTTGKCRSLRGSIAFGCVYNNLRTKIDAQVNSICGGYSGSTNISEGKIATNSNGSVAIGSIPFRNSDAVNIIAHGEGSQAFGYLSVDAYGTGTMCINSGTTSKAESGYNHYAFVHGKWNQKSATASQYHEIVGNGTDDANRSNAYTLDWSGNAAFAGTLSSVGSDFAEYFEWLDGNEDKEDRIGKIVTLNGTKIEYANEGDDVLGIISGTATVLGDNAEWYWHKRYLQDDYGRFIYEDYDIEHEAVIDPETGEVISPAWTEHVHTRKQNPDWDPEEPYIKREDRPEWAIVGMLGKLYVEDDGTAIVGGYVKPNNGIATASAEKTNMRVMKRVNDHVIWVCVK